MVKEKNNGTKRFVEDNIRIVNKEGEEVDFILNNIQRQYLTIDTSNRDIVLKARQQGFSSLILARFTKDFILKDNSLSVVVADGKDNATDLLSRVKQFLSSYERKNKFKIPLKYNSKYELQNQANNARYIIGTAQDQQFGRSKTITNLHLSEAAFYPDFEKLMAGALQAVVPSGNVVIETTANGFNAFKDFWTRSEKGETGFTPLFYPASKFYDSEYLAQKEKELGRYYRQEYPETALEAFITSGDCFFNLLALEKYLAEVKKPISKNIIYV